MSNTTSTSNIQQQPETKEEKCARIRAHWESKRLNYVRRSHTRSAKRRRAAEKTAPLWVPPPPPPPVIDLTSMPYTPVPLPVPVPLGPPMSPIIGKFEDVSFEELEAEFEQPFRPPPPPPRVSESDMDEKLPLSPVLTTSPPPPPRPLRERVVPSSPVRPRVRPIDFIVNGIKRKRIYKVDDGPDSPKRPHENESVAGFADAFNLATVADEAEWKRFQDSLIDNKDEEKESTEPPEITEHAPLCPVCYGHVCTCAVPPPMFDADPPSPVPPKTPPSPPPSPPPSQALALLASTYAEEQASESDQDVHSQWPADDTS